MKYFSIIIAFLSLASIAVAESRISKVRKRISPSLQQELKTQGLELGDPVYLRVFKQERELELWMKPRAGKSYKLVKTYPIAGMSGVLGPKEKEGDHQAPEGFYEIVKKNLNPKSSYHLSFNIGYPNAYDRAHKRTGSFIMVHGSNVSVGCYAMTDPVIEVIYVAVEAALNKGHSSVPFHSYPFRYTNDWEKKVKSPWIPFWKNLESGYHIFQKEKRVPIVKTAGKSYLVN